MVMQSLQKSYKLLNIIQILMNIINVVEYHSSK